MTSDRAYRRALPHEVALAELERCGGTQFDRECVDAFAKSIDAHLERRRNESLTPSPPAEPDEQ